MKRRLFLLFANMLGLSSASRASAVESAGGSPSETGSSSAHARATTPNGFDWRRTSARRPVFTVDYWPGIPAIDKEGRRDISSDLEHFKSYADPVTVRTQAFAFRPAPPASISEARGWFTLPDLLHLTGTALRDWQRAAQSKLANA